MQPSAKIHSAGSRNRSPEPQDEKTSGDLIQEGWNGNREAEHFAPDREVRPKTPADFTAALDSNLVEPTQATTHPLKEIKRP